MSNCNNCTDDCEGVPKSFILSEFSESNVSQEIEVLPGQCVIVRGFRIRDTVIKAEIVEKVCGFELTEALIQCGVQVQLGVETGNEAAFCKPGRYRFKAFEADGTTPVEIGLSMPILVKSITTSDNGCGC